MKYEQYVKDNRAIIEQMIKYGKRYCDIKKALSEITYQGDHKSFNKLLPYLDWEEDNLDMTFYDDRLEVGFDDAYECIFMTFEGHFFDITEENEDEYFAVLSKNVMNELGELERVKLQAEEDLKIENAKKQEQREFEEYRRLHKKFGNQRK